MNLDPDLCYLAVRSRDPRFDGRFFTGVLTTGIYCRPVCPARLPKRENVRFFPCAAAAEDAGFRPCLRCRPETAPGTPAWLGTSAVVSRGLRSIADGALNEGTVADLASRLGMGERQFRRLFVQHLGASPQGVAQSQRAHFARKLCDETALSMTEVAFAAGFQSLRQFNAAMKETFGRPPSELRKMARSRIPHGTTARGSISLRLAYRNPYDWPAMLAFLAKRAIPGVEAVQGNSYRRSIRVDGSPAFLEVTPDPEASHVVLRITSPGAKGLIRVVQGVRRVFDLEADPVVIRDCLSRDPLLGPLVRKRPGLRVPGAWDPFELTIRGILGQQITVTGAATLAGRLVSEFGTPAPGPFPGVTHLFPSPSQLAAADVARIGLPRARGAAIRSLAAAIVSGSLDLEAGGDPAETLRRLRDLPGLGDWTVQYVAMRGLSEPDAFPAGDLGVRQALASNGTLPRESEVLQRAEAWRPWRAYATLHLWIANSEASKVPRQKVRKPKVTQQKIRKPKVARRQVATQTA